MTTLRRALVPHAALLVLVALVAVAGSARPASAEDKRGIAAVEAVDPVANSVQLDGETHYLTPNTHFTMANGRSGDLQRLRTRPADGDLVAITDVDHVEYTSSKVRGRWRLSELHVLERLPD
jgi:hypothetical protein